MYQKIVQVAIESGGMLPKRLSAFQRVRAEYADIIASTWEAVHSCQERVGAWKRMLLKAAHPKAACVGI